MRRLDGSVALLGLTFTTHGQGREQKSYIELEAKRGLPLQLTGPNYGFTFKGSHAAFHPPFDSYRIDVGPKGYSVVMTDPPTIFRLYHEKPET